MRYTPKLYLESTIFNFYFLEKESQKKEDTRKLFEAIGKGKYIAYTSEYVINELALANPLKREMMKKLLENNVRNIIFFREEIDALAGAYVEKGIIPLKYLTDAKHIAAATVCNLDSVVSYNMGHIVKLKTIIGTGFANLHHGYRQIGLCTPKEVLEYDID